MAIIAPIFDPFYSAKLRIDRAEEHLDDLEAEIDQFFAKNPYTYVIEPDPDGIHDIHKLQLTERFPLRWRILATEIVEHLRASLDHATWATAYLKSGNPDLAKTAFPFASTAAKLNDSMRRRSKDIPTEIQALLRTFQPYERGNGTLYFLNSLCNTSKHALITFMAAVTVNAESTGSGLSGPFQFCGQMVWDSEKNEIEYARVERGVKFEHQANLGAFVALQHKELTSPVAATTILDMIHSEVKRIVAAIEAESRRIGLIK